MDITFRLLHIKQLDILTWNFLKEKDQMGVGPDMRSNAEKDKTLNWFDRNPNFLTMVWSN